MGHVFIIRSSRFYSDGNDAGRTVVNAKTKSDMDGWKEISCNNFVKKKFNKGGRTRVYLKVREMKYTEIVRFGHSWSLFIGCFAVLFGHVIVSTHTTSFRSIFVVSCNLAFLVDARLS